MNKRNIKKAVIVAGGKGTRLVKVEISIPKALIKIGAKPLIEHQINLLKKHGIKEIYILSGYLGGQIKRYLGGRRKLGVKIHYRQEKRLLGTAGAIKSLEKKIKEDFLVLFGDVMMNLDIKKFIKWHGSKMDKIGSIVIHPNDHLFDSNLIKINKRKEVTALFRKPHPPGMVLPRLSIAGVYIFSPDIFKYIPAKTKFDIEKDALPSILNSKDKLFGYDTLDYLKDMGTPERLAEVRKDYLVGKISGKRKAIFMDRDGVINKKVGHLYKIKNFKLLPGVAKAVKKINDSEFLAIVITNQPVVARGQLTIKKLEKIHKKMEMLIGREKARLDAVYYCPHHPDKGFAGENKKYKIECNCRKPKTGMVMKAEKDFNIDLKRSYFVGDSYRDILCGKNAGLTTVGLKGGDFMTEEGKKTRPDYLADDFSEAANFIINQSYENN